MIPTPLATTNKLLCSGFGSAWDC